MIEWWPLDKLLNAQELRGELYSYQIMSILLALENLSGKNDYGIGLYHGWINSRKKRDPFESTINLSILARSFEINGFSEKFPLAIDPTDNLLNGGTHRTACSIFYNLEKVFRDKCSLVPIVMDISHNGIELCNLLKFMI